MESGLKKLTRKEVIQLVKIKKTIKDENEVIDRTKFTELKTQLDNKAKNTKLLQECKKLLKNVITFEARKLHKKFKTEKDDKANNTKARYEIVKGLKPKILAEEIISGEYEKDFDSTDPVLVEKKRIFGSKNVKDFINKLPKQVLTSCILLIDKKQPTQPKKRKAEEIKQEEMVFSISEPQEEEEDERSEEEAEKEIEKEGKQEIKSEDKLSEEEEATEDVDELEEFEESSEEEDIPIVMTPELSSILDKLNKRNDNLVVEEDVVFIDPEDVDSDDIDLEDEKEEEEKEVVPPTSGPIKTNASPFKANDNKNNTQKPLKPKSGNNKEKATTQEQQPVTTKRKNRLGQNARKKLAAEASGITVSNSVSSKKEDNRAIKKAKIEDSNIHPSWLAKKQENQNVGFSGKKIKFDDS